MANDTMNEENKFIIEEFLPDYKEEEISVNLNKDKRTLEITAKKSYIEKDVEKYKKTEKRFYEEEDTEGFYKKIDIPKEVKIDTMQKTFYKDGTLSIVFEK